MTRSKKRRRAANVADRGTGAPRERDGLGRVIGTSGLAPSRLALVVLLALAVLPYANALANGFVLDDITMIVENPLVRDVGSIRTIFETHYWARGDAALVGDPTLYRPLTVLSYAVDFALWDGRPAGFHAVNVVLHAVTTLVLFVVALQLLGSFVAAFSAAAIFAVHPLHTEAVTSVVGRAEVLAALFFLLAFHILRRRAAFSVGAMPNSSLGRCLVRAAAGASLYLLGLFSKEIAVTLPAVLALDDWLHRDELPRDRGSAVTVLAGRYGALAIAAAIYFAFRVHAVSGTSQMWPGFVGVSAVDRVLTASRVLMEYVGLFVFPRTLMADYWKPDVPIAGSLADVRVLASIVLWAGLAAFVIRRRTRDAAVVFAVAWFFITIAPVSNVFFPIGVGKAERLMYLPSVGLCLVAGWAYGRAATLVRAPWLPRIALAAIVIALGARTAVRNRDWRDNLTLATATLNVSPSSPLMNDIAAGELVRRGESARAVELLRVAVREAPDMPLLRGHLGAALYAQGAIDQAIAVYEEAIRRNPADAEAHNNLAVAYLDKRRVSDAVAELEAAIRVNPNYADAHMNLGVARIDQGQWNDAVAEFTQVVRARPSSAAAHNALGVAYFRMGQVDRATESYREALRLEPGFAPARANLARVDSARSAGAR